MHRRNFLRKSTFGTFLLGAGGVIKESAENPLSNESIVNVNHSYDVIVCGGGPAGFAAALASARNGARTALIEMQGYLGGIWTAGLMNQIIDFANKEGIMKELMEELQQHGTSVYPYLVDPENMKIILEDMSAKAGVHLRYYTRIVNAKVDDNTINGIVTISNSGNEIWKAKVFIDATGNGDLAAIAGCEFDIGHPETGEVQPMTLRAIVGGLKLEDIKDSFITASGVPNQQMKDAFRQEIEKAGVSPSYAMPSLSYIHASYFALMANHEYNVSALDAGEMTKATIRARQENNEIVKGLQRLGGIWKNVHLVATGHQIGIREARRIAGRYKLTVDDMIRGANFEDGICTVTYFADIHSLNKDNSKGYSDGGIKVKPYQIPLRSLIARDVNGLMMAGRCISGDFYAHASYRVTGNAVPMGEAAGKCAAWAAKNNLMPHQVKYEEIT